MDVTKEGLSSYSVWRHVLSSTKEVAIEEEEYKKIARADDIRREIANIEEKFFVICENYRELEEFVFSTNVKNMLYTRESASAWFSIGTEFGRLTLSMLASSRLYIDTVETHAKKISAGDLSKADIKAVISGMYDKSFAYRAVEAIRNHAQHDAFPVKSASYGQSWDDAGENHTFKSEFFFEVSSLERDTKFKAETMKEIKDMGGKIELLGIIRNYFCDMCEMHLAFRGMFESYKNESSSIIGAVRALWCTSQSTDDLVGVVAGRLSGGIYDKSVPLIHLSLQADEYGKFLSQRTAQLRNMRANRVAW